MALYPHKSLDAVVVTGPGETRDLEHTYRAHGLVAVTTGAPTAFQVDFEVSFDGTNWFSLGSFTQASTHPVWFPDAPTRYTRANLVSLSGGTDPTVSAWTTTC